MEVIFLLLRPIREDEVGDDDEEDEEDLETSATTEDGESEASHGCRERERMGKGSEEGERRGLRFHK